MQDNAITICAIESSTLPTQWAVFDLHGFADNLGKEHVALTLGDVADGELVLVRMHSECVTGDALFSLRCDCGAQLQLAMQQIADQGRGALLYLRQEGRGIGLLNKIKAYRLQDTGLDTVEANQQLGFQADNRHYGIAKLMLQHLGIDKVRLMTNNPHKVDALTALDIEVVERVPLQTPSNPHNVKYIATKAGKLGHWMD